MLGHKPQGQLELFVTGSLRSLIPDDHVLARVDAVLDLEWLRDEVRALYCLDKGRPGIDPEVAIRLMLTGFLLGIVHDRKLMREAQVNLAIRWFVGYALHEELPDHSSLTRIRQRWGDETFRKVFTRVVRQCQQAGLITAETVHMDASFPGFRGRTAATVPATPGRCQHGLAGRAAPRCHRRGERHRTAVARHGQTQETLCDRP